MSWIAKEDWASVDVYVDKPCDTVEEFGDSNDKGLTYFSVLNDLVFKGYWPWSSETLDKLTVYDARGMVANILPCPNMLTPAQIAQMRDTVSAVRTDDLTIAEKRVLTRIIERLSVLDGKSLSTSQDGCSDWRDSEMAIRTVDPWTGK